MKIYQDGELIVFDGADTMMLSKNRYAINYPDGPRDKLNNIMFTKWYFYITKPGMWHTLRLLWDVLRWSHHGPPTPR